MPAAVHHLPPARRVSTPKPPAVPPAPKGDYPYCLGQPVSALQSRVAMATELLQLTGRPFDWDSAVADYMVETDKGKPETWSLEDRAARWGWAVSKTTMHRRMERVREDASDRADLYRSKRAARDRAEAQARFGAPAEESSPNPAPGLERERNGGGTERNERGTKPPESGNTGRSAERDETEAERERNGGGTALPHTSRATDHRPHTNIPEQQEPPRARGEPNGWGLGSSGPDTGPLPENVERYRDRIDAALALPDGDRERWAFRVLAARTGHLVQIRADLGALTDDGLTARAVAALVVTEAEAEASSHRARLAFFRSVLDRLSDHARLDALPPSQLPAATQPAHRQTGGRPRRAPVRRGAWSDTDFDA